MRGEFQLADRVGERAGISLVKEDASVGLAEPGLHTMIDFVEHIIRVAKTFVTVDKCQVSVRLIGEAGSVDVYTGWFPFAR